jgi:hypothetical protein
MDESQVCWLCLLGHRETKRPAKWQIKCVASETPVSVFACDYHYDAIVTAATSAVNPEITLLNTH